MTVVEVEGCWSCPFFVPSDGFGERVHQCSHDEGPDVSKVPNHPGFPESCPLLIDETLVRAKR